MACPLPGLSRLFATGTRTFASTLLLFGLATTAAGVPLAGAPLAAQGSHWRSPDPADLLYLELESGRVVIELAPDFAPLHVENIRRFTAAGFFDGGAVVRSQDNYVAQWQVRTPGPDEGLPEGAVASLPAEFEADAANLAFVPLPDPDTYAPEVGFVAGMPAGRDPAAGTAWIVHCYGAVGVARGTDPGSGSGAELYAVTGHAPRHLDRNLTMVGRVLFGMEHLSTLPRGTDALGFYATPAEYAPILNARMASDLPPSERTRIEVMRTDSDAYREYVQQRRTRTEDFFVHPVDRVGVCNAMPPIRARNGGG